MVANYQGKSNESRYRLAELNWDEDKEEEKAVMIMDIMEEKYGWAYFSRFGGYACLQVENIDEYRYFMKDLKKAKKQVRESLKSNTRA